MLVRLSAGLLDISTARRLGTARLARDTIVLMSHPIISPLLSFVMKCGRACHNFHTRLSFGDYTTHTSFGASYTHEILAQRVMDVVAPGLRSMQSLQ